MKCTEQVRQEKLGKDDKVELKEESTYDYLVILTKTGRRTQSFRIANSDE